MQFSDQINHTISLQSFPKRIISLVPSQSELLWDLGLREEIIGITKFCIHPKEMFKTVQRIGGTKTLNLEKIRALKPDLIIGNKEENEQAQVLELQKEFPVWMSDINNLNESIHMITQLGILLNKSEKANEIAHTIQTSFNNFKKNNQTVLYLIWKDPYMAAGKATFIGDMLFKMGLKNVIEDVQGRYPELSLRNIKALNPDLIYLSSEPYPFKNGHIDEIQNLLPNAKISLVDGELFSWYGSRLLESVNYFNTLLK